MTARTPYQSLWRDKQACCYEYRHVDEEVWHLTTKQRVANRCGTKSAALLGRGEIPEARSRDGLVVFRRKPGA